MNLNKIKSFYTFVKAGYDYYKTAKILNISHAAVRKHITTLEIELGVALIGRVDKKNCLTPEGESFYESSQDILKSFEQAYSNLRSGGNINSGKITICTTYSIASLWLMDDIASFVKEYPDINIKVLASDRAADLFSREADIAIRFISDQNSALFQERLTTYQFNLFASKDYIEKYGAPTSVEDLSHHKIISYGEDVALPYRSINWHLDLLPRSKSCSLEINSGIGILNAIENGFGIGSISNVGDTIANNKLVRILPKLITGPKLDVGFCYPKTHKLTDSQLSLLEHLKENMK